LQAIIDRIDNITGIKPEYLHKQLPAPESVKIELSPRCNYRCGFCALRTREVQPTEDMDFDLFKRITQEMRDAGVDEIGCFYLGESMMNPVLLIDAIEWCKSIGFPYVFLTTNGSLAEKWVLREIMRVGLDSLKFSINACDDEQFEEIIGVKAKNYHKALKAVKEAREIRDQGYKCKISASSILYEGEQKARMEALLEKYIYPYVDQHYWLPLYSMGAFAAQREAELGYRPTAGNQGRIDALREPLPCWSVFTEGHVRADGGLSACCFDAGGDWVMGDLKTTSFMEAWNSDKFQKLREAHLNKNVTGTICENCVAY